MRHKEYYEKLACAFWVMQQSDKGFYFTVKVCQVLKIY